MSYDTICGSEAIALDVPADQLFDLVFQRELACLAEMEPQDIGRISNPECQLAGRFLLFDRGCVCHDDLLFHDVIPASCRRGGAGYADTPTSAAGKP